MARIPGLRADLALVAFAGALAVSACSGGGENASQDSPEEAIAIEAPEEPEIERTSAPRSGDPADDNVEYMRRLGMVRGHLTAFIELYRAGERDAAMAHVAHLESETYPGLIAAFEARDKPGFADALAGLASTAETGGDVDAAYAIIGAAIVSNAPAHSAGEKLTAVAEMVRAAGEDFGAAVEENGEISNARKYQDAYGILSAAREMLSAEDTNDINEADAIAFAHEQLDISLAMFEGLMAETTEGLASTIEGAAARIERAAERLP